MRDFDMGGKLLCYSFELSQVKSLQHRAMLFVGCGDTRLFCEIKATHDPDLLRHLHVNPRKFGVSGRCHQAAVELLIPCCDFNNVAAALRWTNSPSGVQR